MIIMRDGVPIQGATHPFPFYSEAGGSHAVCFPVNGCHLPPVAGHAKLPFSEPTIAPGENLLLSHVQNFPSGAVILQATSGESGISTMLLPRSRNSSLVFHPLCPPLHLTAYDEAWSASLPNNRSVRKPFASPGTTRCGCICRAAGHLCVGGRACKETCCGCGNYEAG